MKRMKIYAIRRGHIHDDAGMPIPAIFIKMGKDSEEIPLANYNDVECFDSNSKYNIPTLTKEEIDELLKNMKDYEI